MLLVAAGLMIRTFFSLQGVTLGFDPSRVLTMRVPLPDRRYPTREHRVQFFQDLLQRLEVVPGVTGVGVNTYLHPFGNLTAAVEVLGARLTSTVPVVVHQTSTGYTGALGIGLVQGRCRRQRGRTAIAVGGGQRGVRPHACGRWPGDRQGGSHPPPDSATGQRRDERLHGRRRRAQHGEPGNRRPDRAEIYLPFTLAGLSDQLVIATQGDPVQMMKPVAAQVLAIDPEQPVVDVLTIENMLQEGSYAGPRFNLVLFTAFAALGLLLAMIGVFGVIRAPSRSNSTKSVCAWPSAQPRRGAAMAVGRGRGSSATGWRLASQGRRSARACSAASSRTSPRSIRSRSRASRCWWSSSACSPASGRPAAPHG